MKENNFKPIQTKLAGVTYEKRQANIRKWGCPDIGWYGLYREPDNPHDPNAVLVSLFGMYDLGYLPKMIAATMAQLMDAGRTFLAEFICINEWPPYDTIGLTVRIVETKRQPFPLF